MSRPRPAAALLLLLALSAYAQEQRRHGRRHEPNLPPPPPIPQPISPRDGSRGTGLDPMIYGAQAEPRAVIARGINRGWDHLIDPELLGPAPLEPLVQPEPKGPFRPGVGIDDARGSFETVVRTQLQHENEDGWLRVKDKAGKTLKLRLLRVDLDRVFAQAGARFHGPGICENEKGQLFVVDFTLDLSDPADWRLAEAKLRVR